MLLQGFLAASNLYTVWGTADAPIVIQRDPAAADSAAPVVIGGEQLISNTSYLFFKDITFSARSATGTYGGNAIRMWGRWADTSRSCKPEVVERAWMTKREIELAPGCMMTVRAELS